MDPLDLLSGDASAFVSDVWAHRVHIHKADAEPLTQLLSIDDADALLTSSAMRTPALRVAKNGSVLPSSSFVRPATIAGESVTGLVDARKLLTLFNDGATLVLQGLHRYWPPLTQLIRGLERALGHPCQANAYLTPPGAQGFSLHSDSHDVFVFQTYGAKQWEVHDRGNPLDVLMEVGTCMYLPAGTPHAARTQDVASLHVTVGINQLTYREVVRRAVDRVLEDARFDDRLPAGYLDDSTALAAGLRRELDALSSGIAELDAAGVADREVRRFLTSRNPVLRGGLTDALSEAAIDDESRLVRRPGAICVLRKPREADGSLTLLLGDRTMSVPGWVEPACRRIAELDIGDVLRPADLADWLDPTSRVVLARRLVREGLLKVAD